MTDQIHFCACIGPVGTDFCCPCEMRRRGWNGCYEWSPEVIARLDAALDDIIAREDPSADTK